MKVRSFEIDAYGGLKIISEYDKGRNETLELSACSKKMILKFLQLKKRPTFAEVVKMHEEDRTEQDDGRHDNCSYCGPYWDGE